MRIAVDAAAGPQAPPLAPLIEGCARAARESGATAVFYGARDALEAELQRAGFRRVEAGAAGLPAGATRWQDGEAFVESVHAPVALDPSADPQTVCRDRPDAAVMLAAAEVGAGRAAGLVSAAPAALLAAAGVWHIKRLRGALRPALLVPVGTRRGVCYLVDAGLNSDCRPWHLLQFALMGALFAKHAAGIERPGVGLLAPAAPGSGQPELVRESVPLLKYAGLEFRGALPGDALPEGACEVLVADGSLGAVVLRLYEGLSCAPIQMLESELSASWFGRARQALVSGALERTQRRLRPAASSAAVILGVGGTLVQLRSPESVAASAEALHSAVRTARSGVSDRIRERLEDVKSAMESARAGD